MERVKSLFAGRKSSRVRGAQLKAQSYDAVTEAEKPIMGSMPVTGNGHTLAELRRVESKRYTRRQSSDTAAAPSIRRERRDSYGQRPMTAPSKGRTRSGFSMKSPPEFLTALDRRTEPPIPNIKLSSLNQRTPSMTNSLQPPPSMRTLQNTNHSRVGSSHIDLFDAVSSMSTHARKASSHKAIAISQRDYGEDVADRNIADFGSGDINLNSPQYSYLKNFYAREDRLQRTSTKRDHNNNDSGVGLGKSASKRDDDSKSSTPRLSKSTETPNNNPNFQTINEHLSPPGHPKRPFTERTSSLTSTTSRDFHYPTNTDRARTRSLARSPPPPPAITSSIAPAISKPSALPVVPLASQEIVAPLQARRASIASTKSYIPSRGQGEAYVPSGSTSHTRDPSVASVRSRTRSTHTVSTEPSRGLTDSPTVPAFPVHARIPSSGTNKSVSTYAPAPPLPSIDLKHLQGRGRSPLPTPPMSPSAQANSMSSVDQHKRGSSEKGHSRSRDSRDGNTDSKTVSQSTQSNDKRKGMLFDGNNGALPVNGGLNLENSVHTDRTVSQAPAVIHEFVQPRVHNVIEESITREIHTHDVFHRILPVIDVEVLPTKHLVPHPTVPESLVEISGAQVPSRQTNWQISVNGSIAPEDASSSDNTKLFHRAHENPEPILASKKTYITKHGYPRTEYVWRHPPVLEPLGYTTGQTQPLRMNCVENEHYQIASGEEGLLYKDTGYGLVGMLPGLQEKTPMATVPIPSSRAGTVRNEEHVRHEARGETSILSDDDSNAASLGRLQLQ